MTLCMLPTKSRKLTDAESGWFNDVGRWTGTARLHLAEVEPVADDSELEIVILIAHVYSNDV